MVLYRVTIRDEERGLDSTHYLDFPSAWSPEKVRDEVEERRSGYESVTSVELAKPEELRR